VESSSYLLLHCSSVISIWYDVFRWYGGGGVVIPPNLFVLFEVFKISANNTKIRQGFLMIWHANLWSI
jgi:hypothetical protein